MYHVHKFLHSMYGAVLLKQSTRGALFQITLASRGYVFVGKGTAEAFPSDLLHEGQVYKLFRQVQGSATPVYLCSIDLKENVLSRYRSQDYPLASYILW